MGKDRFMRLVRHTGLYVRKTRLYRMWIGLYVTTLYLSGPMAGLPEHNFPAFHAARAKLRAASYTVVCPAELGKCDGWTWEQYLRRDIRVLMDCDGVATLPGIDTSRGATLETFIARKLKMTVEPVQYWLNRIKD